MELRTYDKAKITLTQAQADAVLRAITQGDKFVILKKAYILVSNISGIYPLELVEEHTNGRLHDGTRVVKMYGRWVDADNPDIKLSYSHYPELANDTVMTERQYQEKRAIALIQGPPENKLLKDPDEKGSHL